MMMKPDEFWGSFTKLSAADQEQARMDLLVYGQAIIRVGNDGTVSR